MDKISTYQLIPLPDAVQVLVVAVALSFALAPWFGGTKIGSVSIPELSTGARRRFKVLGPMAFIVTLMGFAEIWSSGNENEGEVTAYEEPGEANLIPQDETATEEIVVYGCIGPNCREIFRNFEYSIEYDRSCEWHSRQNNSNLAFAEEICADLNDGSGSWRGIRLSTQTNGSPCGYGLVRVTCLTP